MAIESSTIPHLQTRWYSPLSGVSIRRTPEPPRFIKERPERVVDAEADAEQAGTIIISPQEEGRRTLRPQPSLDPNDPLNWPKWHKYRTYLTVCFFTFLATANSTKFMQAAAPISDDFQLSTTKVNFLTCFNILALGVGNLFWVPLMRVIGKRPVYLISLPILVASSIWSFSTVEYKQLLASSILSGFASGAAEAIVPTIVTDLFFVHERGSVLMIFQLAISSGMFLEPLIDSYVVQYYSWRMICEWMAIAAGVTWLVAIFTVHETSYYNREIYRPFTSFGRKHNFAQKLGMTIGYNKDQTFFGALGDSIPMIAYPSVLWSAFIVGIFSGWNIIAQIISAESFTNHPYNFEQSFVGLFSISGFIGAVLSFFFGGKLIDMISTRRTLFHKGRREPEYRLYAIIIPIIIGPMGILLFGFTIAEARFWLKPGVGYAMHGFGLTAISNIVVTYVVDSYLPLAAESMAIIFVVKGIIGAVLILYTINWVEAAGEKQAFGEMVGIQYFFCLFVIIFFLFGKKIRALTVRYGPMKWGGHGNN